VKRKKILFIAGILFAAVAVVSILAFFPSQGKNSTSIIADYSLDGCTVIIVGKDASTDGSVMTTHTCDCGLCDWTWRYVPATDHDPNSTRKIYHIDQFKTLPPEQGLKWEIYKNNFTGVEIPQVPHTYAYLHGAFGYFNDQQLALGESTIGCQREMNNPTPSATFDITMLTLLAMEQCKTAREAIKLMGSLGEKYGYGFTIHPTWIFRFQSNRKRSSPQKTLWI